MVDQWLDFLSVGRPKDQDPEVDQKPAFELWFLIPKNIYSLFLDHQFGTVEAIPRSFSSCTPQQGLGFNKFL
jgi:hypothetical protein